jgi:hypothetical protein
MLDPAVLGDDPAAVEAALAAKLFDLEHIPRREAAAVRPRPGAQARHELVTPEWTPVKVERTAVIPALEQGVGLVLGLGLAGVLIAEVYLDVVYVFGAGRILLGFAVALEACSRALDLGRSPRRRPESAPGRAPARSAALLSWPGTSCGGAQAANRSSRRRSRDCWRRWRGCSRWSPC